MTPINKPVKISERLTIMMRGDKALVVAQFAIPPKEAKEIVEHWLIYNSGHARALNVRQWLEWYEEQNPDPVARQEVSPEKWRAVTAAMRIRNRLAERLMILHPGISLEEARKRVDAFTFED